MLDSLDNLSITIQNYNTSTAFSLEPLSGLRSLCINWSYRDHWPKQSLISQISMLISRCPDLESFKFTSPYFRRPQPESGPPMSLGQILAGLSSLDMSLRLKQLVVIGIVVSPDDFLLRLRHFRYLEKLEIGWSSDPDLAIHFGEICAILHAEGIHLKDITGAIIHHPAIIRYLASYSGIERMVLRPSHPLDDSTQLVDQFFSSVLRQHRNSLRYLELGLNKNTAWSRLLGRDLMIEVERCQRLEELNCWVYVSLEDKRSNNTDILLNWVETAERLPRLSHLGCLLVTSSTGYYPPNPYSVFLNFADEINTFVKRTVDDIWRDRKLGFKVHAFGPNDPDTTASWADFSNT